MPFGALAVGADVFALYEVLGVGLIGVVTLVILSWNDECVRAMYKVSRTRLFVEQTRTAAIFSY